MKKPFILLILMAISYTAVAQYYQQHPKIAAIGLPLAAEFGSTVSLSDDATVAVVGAWGGANSITGQAVILNRNGSVWGQGQVLIGSGSIGGPNQGKAVAFSGDGNTVIIGGHNDNNTAGASWVFIRNSSVWTMQAKLVATGATANAWQGFSVDISGDGNTVIIGAPANNTHVGAAWIFTRVGSSWTQEAILLGTDAVSSVSFPSEQGYCVAISRDGMTAMVGGKYDDGGRGAVWIYTRNGSVWTQQGGKISGSISQPIGTSVALSADGNVGVIGAAAADNYAGGALVVSRSGSIWTPYASILQGTSPVGKAQQGGSVDISADGKTVVIGGAASTFASGTADIGVGATWIFKYDGSAWKQEGNKYVGTANVGNAQQGSSVSISADGNTFMAGGFGDDNFSGAVWLFSKTIPKTSILEQSKKITRIYPNPVNGVLYIESGQKLHFQLVDLHGAVLIEKTRSKALDIAGLAAGMYILRSYSNGQIIQSDKIIKPK